MHYRKGWEESQYVMDTWDGKRSGRNLHPTQITSALGSGKSAETINVFRVRIYSSYESKTNLTGRAFSFGTGPFCETAQFRRKLH
ncbi:hypothetical protein CEXT_565331 [Caerostris extrusa]|uniref:Uncharacterized protein n=1 Tax=Caerostris extrusa TaxID=172846 RepID=A0AAV4XCS0_CAEEX|nr:hypothetical protein CEXT_565331 [Caerostris extrusa]